MRYVLPREVRRNCSCGEPCWAPGDGNAGCLSSEDKGGDGAAAAAAAAAAVAEVPAAAALDKWDVRVGETLRVVDDATVVERATRAGQAAGVEWSDDLRRVCGKRGAAAGALTRLDAWLHECTSVAAACDVEAYGRVI